MKYLARLFAAACLLALASGLLLPQQQRGQRGQRGALETIVVVFANVRTSIRSLTDAISDPAANQLSLTAASNELLQSFQVGTALLQRVDGRQLSVLSSISPDSLAGAADGLAEDTSVLTEALVNRRPVIEATGTCASVLMQLAAVRDGARSLAAAFFALLPGALREGALSVNNDFFLALEDIGLAFNEENCDGTGTGTGTPPALVAPGGVGGSPVGGVGAPINGAPGGGSPLQGPVQGPLNGPSPAAPLAPPTPPTPGSGVGGGTSTLVPVAASNVPGADLATSPQPGGPLLAPVAPSASGSVVGDGGVVALSPLPGGAGGGLQVSASDTAISAGVPDALAIGTMAPGEALPFVTAGAPGRYYGSAGMLAVIWGVLFV